MESKTVRLAIGAVIFAVAMIMEFLIHCDSLWILAVSLVGYIIVGYDVIIEMFEGFREKEIFTEETLMSVATIGAFLIGSYVEAMAVMLLFQIGEMLEDLAVSRSKDSVMDLMDLQPETANIVTENGERTVPVSELKIGDVVLVKTGEKVPADGTVIEGSSSFDMSDLTGESMPKDISCGDLVLSGSINVSAVVKIRVEKESKDSTASRIIELIEDAEDKKSKSERYLRKFARYYTPAVMVLAVIVAIVPPLFTGDWRTWIYRAMTLLVTSCPCAMVISIPLAFYCGIGKASTEGILIKGGNYLEALSKTDTVVMDKTGTLTRGEFVLREIHPVGIGRDELLSLVTDVERYSNHPISGAFSGLSAGGHTVDSVKDVPGMGLSATVDGMQILIGNTKLVHPSDDVPIPSDQCGVILHVSVDGEYRGYVTAEDEIKEDSYLAMKALSDLGISNTVMLTGDREIVGRKVGGELGIKEVYTDLLPADKLGKVEDILGEMDGKGTLVYVGDGTNDAPVLARSHVGIAMGALGSDAAISAADVVIMTDRPSKVPDSIRLSKKVMSTVRVNMFSALAVKFLFMVLTVLGILSMWGGVFADVGMLLILVLNSVRLLGRGWFSSLFKAKHHHHCDGHCCCHD